MNLSLKKQRLAIIGLLLLWCSALQTHCFYIGGDRLSIGLLWNLLLAAVPLVWGAGFQAAAHKRPATAGVFFGLWLLFLPNAPYILTDLIHLGPRPNIPLWYYLAMLLSCAGAGTLLGYLSLLDVHATVEEKFGKTAGWVMAAGSLLLCGFGIYLGRFLRWNSWDALTNPGELLHSIARQFADSGPFPHPLPVTVVFGIGLLIGYLALRVLAHPVPGRLDVPNSRV